MPDKLTSLLKRLSSAAGVSGSESAARTVVQEVFAPLVDEVSVDMAGNVIALKRGTGSGAARHRLMLSAHMDEIGALVSGMQEEFLRFTGIGGLDNRVLLGQEVLVHAKHPLPGVVASRPPHVVPREERNQVIPRDQLFIDVGLTAEAVREQVSVGDVISFLCEPVELLGDLVTGKALDNRASVAAIYACLEHLVGMQHSWDVYAVATVQEEHGDFLGAKTCAFRLHPDLALIVDTTYGDAPGLSQAETVNLAEGPALSIGPNIHPVLYRRLAELADALEIPRQIEPLPGHSGTEGWGIQVSREGIPTSIISLPVRNLHTPVEIASVKDVARAGRLMAHFVAGLEESFVKQLIPDTSGS
jgi:putative aminopeptidase FrvX